MWSPKNLWGNLFDVAGERYCYISYVNISYGIIVLVIINFFLNSKLAKFND